MSLAKGGWARWDIRAQLITLVAGALLPLIAFVALSLHYRSEDAERQLRQVASHEAAQLQAAVDSHLSLIEGVLGSLAPRLSRDGGLISQAELESIGRHLPAYVHNIMVVDASGRALSSRVTYTREQMEAGVSGRPYLAAALRTQRFVVSEPFTGRLSPARLFVGALAFHDAHGRPAGAVILSTDVESFRKHLLADAASHKVSAAVLSDNGEPIVISEGAPALESFREALRDAGRKVGASGELKSVGSEEGRYAAYRSTRAPWTVVVVTDPEVAVREYSPYYKMLAAAVIALMLALAAAIAIARRITRPLRLLREGAEALGRGELRHRVPVLGGEAGHVGEAFNSMARQLEAQRLTIRADAERFRAIFHNCPLPMAISDLESGALLEVNAAFTAISGKTANEVIGRSSGQVNLWVDAGQRERALALLRERGRIEAFECRHRVRDGKEADLLLFAELVRFGERGVIVSTSVDVTERKDAEKRLKEMSKRLTLATRSARIGIWDLDLRTRQLVWDETMFALYGLAPRDFDGRFEDWLRRVASEDRVQLDKCRVEALSTSDQVDIQYRILRADGTVRHLRSSASVERDEMGIPVRLMGTTRDVTENVLGREALARVNSELEARVVERTGALQETVRELEAFSYTVAHDLRAPLRAIDGFSSYLVQELPPREPGGASDLIGKIRRNVGCMDRLIDGLLNYARLGRQTFRPVPVDMTALANEVRGELADSHSGTKITIDAMPGALGDPQMLRQVWSNLIGNACKFSQGKDAPQVAIGSTTDAEGTIYFVWDNGVGFDMRYRDRLFRVFERLHTDVQFGGTGVGLAVVQRVMQRHSGVVWAEGFPGEGSTFYFRLPDRSLGG
jgi:PAS domain S-box-containing protein